eukprot:331898-Pelagomonas_calceolata.AAC.1
MGSRSCCAPSTAQASERQQRECKQMGVKGGNVDMSSHFGVKPAAHPVPHKQQIAWWPTEGMEAESQWRRMLIQAVDLMQSMQRSQC